MRPDYEVSFKFLVTGHDEKDNARTFSATQFGSTEENVILHVAPLVAKAFGIPVEQIVVDSVHLAL